jgi:4-amino-4-deoxy-L-arabinose transferase-like glycosyltransferase
MPLRLLWVSLGLVTLLRIYFGATAEVSAEEAYGFMQARFNGLVSIEGGQLAQMVIRPLLAWEVPIWVLRLPNSVLVLGTSLLLWRLLHSLEGERAAIWGVLVWNMLPWANLVCLRHAPELWAMLLGLWGLWELWRGLHAVRRGPLHFAAAGVLWALGLLCHWGALFWPLGALAALAASRRWRPILLKGTFWLAGADFLLLGFGPLIWWNSQNAWAGWHWLWMGPEGTQKDFFSLETLSRAFWPFFQIGSPLFALVFIWGVLLALRHLKKLPESALFLLPFLLPGAVFALFAFLLTKDIWSSLIPLLPVPVGLFAVLRERASFPEIWLKMARAGLAVAGGLSLLSVHCPERLASPVAQLTGAPGVSHWAVISAEVTQVLTEARAQSSEALFLIAQTPHLAAALEQHLPPHLPLLYQNPHWPCVFVPEHHMPQHSYTFWPRYDVVPPNDPALFSSKNALYLTEHPSELPQTIAEAFSEVSPLLTFQVRLKNRVQRTYRIYQCQSYQGLRL